MVVVGADVHKRTHTFVAVDEVGRELGAKTFEAATRRAPVRRCGGLIRSSATIWWAIEYCRHLSARLERDLLSAGQSVVRVPPKMMAEQRRSDARGGSPIRLTRWRLRGLCNVNRICRWRLMMTSLVS